MPGELQSRFEIAEEAGLGLSQPAALSDSGGFDPPLWAYLE